eukprot:4639017-Prymnesium_polylepis.1
MARLADCARGAWRTARSTAELAKRRGRMCHASEHPCAPNCMLAGIALQPCSATSRDRSSRMSRGIIVCIRPNSPCLANDGSLSSAERTEGVRCDRCTHIRST